MGERRRRLAISVATLAMLLAACGGPSEDVVVPRLTSNLTDSSTGFGLTLTDRLLAEPNAGNVFISPLSATMALGMAASASRGATRASILTTLGLDPTVDPSAQARLTIERLMKSDANAQLELAQAAWAQKGLVLNPDYVARLRADYQAQVANLDFNSPGAPKVVNDWVDNATHHKINQLVDAFDPNTVAFLVDATYFHALWATEFKPDSTRAFHTLSGASASVPMMKRDDGVATLVTPDYRAVLLPYKGGRFSMVIVLPGMVLSPAEFARFLTPTRWNEALARLHGAVGPVFGGKTCMNGEAAPSIAVVCDGALVMPKFKLDYSAELLSHLVAMGMTANDLSDICSGCFISRVVQKTHLEIDEKGTTAAAATGGMVATSGHVPTIVDHPFALALIDNASDAPLFLGVVGQL